MKKIRKYLVKKCKLLKSNSLTPYTEEFTVFIRVNIANLKEYSKFILLKLNKDVKTNKEIIKITTVKKYLFISLKSKLILVNINLFIKTFFGLLNERIWLIENLNKE